MRFSPALVAASGLSAEASPAAVEAALLSRLRLADSAMTHLGEPDPVKARGTLIAKLEEAASASSLRAQLAAKSAESDAAERIKKVEWAVATGRLRSGSAWSWGESPKGQRVRSLSAAMAKASAAHPELAAFGSYLEALPVLYEPSREATADTSVAEASAATSRVPPLLLANAARSGIDASALALNVVRLFPSAAQEQ